MFELRTYVSADGKFEQLLARFRDETNSLIAEHNMVVVGFWVDARQKNTLHYLVKHDGFPEENWNAFLQDPRWAALVKRTEQNGKLAASMDSIFMDATEFSALN